MSGTTPEDVAKMSLRIHATVSDSLINTVTVKGLKVLEYQQGMENWDIPYFEGNITPHRMGFGLLQTTIAQRILSELREIVNITLNALSVEQEALLTHGSMQTKTS